MTFSPTIKLAQELIKEPSITPNDARCQKIISDFLINIGFTVVPININNVSNIWAFRKGKTKQKFDEFRDNYFDYYNQAGYLWHERIARNNDKQLITPYLSFRVKDYFYNKDWYELNEPFQKHNVVNSFDEFKKFKFKKHINLQLGAGIDKLFETLLDNRKVNFKNRKRVMDICRDWSTQFESLGVLPI